MKYYKFIGLILLILLGVSCEKEKDSNFTLNGTIKGLKKGVVYLQKDGDSGIVDLDSLVIKGDSEFTLQTHLEEPLLLYLKLFKNDGVEHYIPFFANIGTTEIKTTLKNFNFDAEIKGSGQQKLLNDYVAVMKQFSDQNLDLMEATLLAQKNNDSIALDSLQTRTSNLLKRKYSYTIQYALNHNNSEVAPYLALYEMQQANPIYIDSVYKGLTEPIKKSFYGRKLKTLISRQNQDSVQ